jgi:hypothetical protein
MKALLKYGIFIHICEVNEDTRSIKTPKPPNTPIASVNPELPDHTPTFLLFEYADKTEAFMGKEYPLFIYKGEY